MNKKAYKLIFTFFAVSFLLTGCATQAPGMVIDTAPGFWLGLFQGMIAPFAFIGHLFNPSIVVYSAPNNGGWYDFGFLLGVGAFTTGSGKIF